MPVLIDYAAIKAAVPMERVLLAYGIRVERGKAICPFHADKRPSMKVYADGYYCFSCGNGGDAIKFVARMSPRPSWARSGLRPPRSSILRLSLWISPRRSAMMFVYWAMW